MGKWPAKQREYKLSEETAKAAVLEVLNFYDIGLKETEGDDSYGKAAEQVLDELLTYYRAGLLENKRDENLGFCVVQHISTGSEITYREMKGKDRLVHMQFMTAGEVGKKAAALMGRLSGLGEDVINSLMGDDYKAAVSLATIFFTV